MLILDLRNAKYGTCEEYKSKYTTLIIQEKFRMYIKVKELLYALMHIVMVLEVKELICPNLSLFIMSSLIVSCLSFPSPNPLSKLKNNTLLDYQEAKLPYSP
uniref:Uncharacterized protein n=1 Tax=Opuntia streptacantha TaxID=393608 RepID=A0A7C8YEI2_OPUST